MEARTVNIEEVNVSFTAKCPACGEIQEELIWWDEQFGYQGQIECEECFYKFPISFFVDFNPKKHKKRRKK